MAKTYYADDYEAITGRTRDGEETTVSAGLAQTVETKVVTPDGTPGGDQ